MTRQGEHNHIIISVGCNTNYETQMSHARECLLEAFPGIRFTPVVSSPAYGMKDDALSYSNMIAEGHTDKSEDDVQATLKELETALGNTSDLRKKDIVMMDLDLLLYNENKHHKSDWQRPYIILLLKKLALTVLLIFFLLPSNASADNKSAKDLLTHAVEYYQGQKYHECILAFEKLQKRYTLNPRFASYLGYSYYRKGEYDKAIECLEKSIPNLAAYSPQEQAIFIYACAESLFALSKFRNAIVYYEKALPLVKGNDRGDILYHTAFSYYMLMEEYGNPSADFNDKENEGNGDDYRQQALHYFNEAIAEYSLSQHLNPLHKARLAQSQKMVKGLAQ